MYEVLNVSIAFTTNEQIPTGNGAKKKKTRRKNRQTETPVFACIVGMNYIAPEPCLTKSLCMMCAEFVFRFL